MKTKNILTILAILLNIMSIFFFMIYIFLVTISCFAQTDSDNSGRFKMGFHLGFNYSNLHTDLILPEGVLIKNGIGYREGISANYELNNHFSLVGKTDFSYNRSRVEFIDQVNTKSVYKVFQFSLDVMVQIIYKIKDVKNSPFILLGPCYRHPASFKINKPKEQKTKPNFAIDIGIGLENKREYFVLSPELRYSYGLGNVSRNNNFQSLTFHNVSLIFNFR